MPHKFKDAGLFPLVLTKGPIVHKKIDKEIPTALFDQGEFRQPINKLFCRQRKLRPGPVRETKGNIIGQTIILEKKKKTMVVGSIGIKRGSPFEDLFGPLGKDHLKTLLLLKAVRQLILINKLRVSKDDGAETKLIHHQFAMHADLRQKFRLVKLEGQGVIIGFPKKLDTPRPRQLLK